jgi:L-cysteine S-thiosulfotransferase
MKKHLLGFGLLFAGVLLLGCDNLQSGRRLRLPKGSVENGKAAFIALNCTECHTVAGVELPKPTGKPDEVVELGGSVPRLRTVGDLLTSIIHPTQSVSLRWKGAGKEPVQTPMPNVNDVMTVSQMVDLVRFLQPRYAEMEPPVDWTFSL